MAEVHKPIVNSTKADRETIMAALAVQAESLSAEQWFEILELILRLLELLGVLKSSK